MGLVEAEMSEPTAKQVKEHAMRDAIARLLSVCTEKEQQFLHAIHDHAPWKGLKNCPYEKLDETYDLLRRTVMR